MRRLGFGLVMGAALVVWLGSMTDADDVTEQVAPPTADSFLLTPAWEVGIENERPTPPLDPDRMPSGWHRPYGMPMAWWSQRDWKAEPQGEQPTLWAAVQRAEPEGRWEAETTSYVEELAAIRQQVGVDPLEGTLLQIADSENLAGTDDAAFRQAVRTVAENDEGDHPPAGPSPSACFTEWQGRSIRDMRAAACGLDAQANRLEEVDRFALADEIRELAQKIRLAARTHGEEPLIAPPR